MYITTFMYIRPFGPVGFPCEPIRFGPIPSPEKTIPLPLGAWGFSSTLYTGAAEVFGL